VFAPNWFLNPNGGGFSTRWGGSFTSDDFSAGYGLLGCSSPIRIPGELSPSYAGSTCAAAGLDGWLLFRQLITLSAPPATLITPNVYDFGVVVVTRDRAAQFITPEPSTNVLMTAGLLMIGVMVRRRKVRACASR
jgi:hypothetical protein